MDAAKRLREANIHLSHQEECYDFGKKEVIADGLEFSPLSIHSPYYHIDDTCNPYAKDEKLFLETFQNCIEVEKHYNFPQKAEKKIDSGEEELGRSFVGLFVSLLVVRIR